MSHANRAFYKFLVLRFISRFRFRAVLMVLVMAALSLFQGWCDYYHAPYQCRLGEKCAQ